MTAVDTLCDVCRKRPMIGVACTSVPMSVAFCKECAEAGADPEMVFVFWEADIPPDMHAAPDDCCTWRDGEFVSYRRWYDERRAKGIPIPVMEDD